MNAWAGGCMNPFCIGIRWGIAALLGGLICEFSDAETRDVMVAIMREGAE